MRFDEVIQFSDFGEVLKGRQEGRRAFAILCANLADRPIGTVVGLDFSGVVHVTGSWVNSALCPFIDWCSRPETEFFPVFINLALCDAEELELVGHVNNMRFQVMFDDHTSVIGKSDSNALETLRKVRALGETTGAALAREYPEEGIQPSAWNNRLKELHQDRLLKRRTSGRQQIYSTVTNLPFESHGRELSEITS